MAIVGLFVMLAWSPIADRLATRLVEAPPTLGAFRALQKSWVHLAAGIAIAWLLGAFVEEILLRGILLRGMALVLAHKLAPVAAMVVAIAAAALVAGVAHLYQGLRAAIIITQLSALFGVLFVLSGFNLWSVILCHGLYDTVAFVRFARGTSKYAKLGNGAAT